MFGFQNDLKRAAVAGAPRQSSRNFAVRLPTVLSRETQLAFLKDAEFFATGLSTAEAATLAIISCLPPKLTIFLLHKVFIEHFLNYRL